MSIRNPVVVTTLSDTTYELIKPLPGVASGRILEDFGLFVFKSPTTREENMYRFTEEAMKNFPDWFRKINSEQNDKRSVATDAQ
jgi:hypothetical protein